MAKKTVKQNRDGTITVWGSNGYEGKISTAGKMNIPDANVIPIIQEEQTPSSMWERVQSNLDRMEQYLKTGPVTRWVTGEGDSRIKEIRMKLMRRMIIPTILAGKMVNNVHAIGERPLTIILPAAAVSTFVGLSVAAARHREGTVKRTDELAEEIKRFADDTDTSFGEKPTRRHQGRSRLTVSPYARANVAKELSSVGRTRARSQWEQDSATVMKDYLDTPLRKYAETLQFPHGAVRVSVTDLKVKDTVVRMKIERYTLDRYPSHDKYAKIEYDTVTGELTVENTYTP